MAHDGIPYLIQRVSRRKHIADHQKGFDRIFELDYMGSSEFEFGTIPQALKAMRANKNSDWTIRSIVVGKHTAYFVGAPNMLNIATQVFEDELKESYSERKFRHKERTAIYESYHPSEKNKYSQHDAWWALDVEMPFFLFKNKKHAEELMELL
jgi:hypothetical protein